MGCFLASIADTSLVSCSEREASDGTQGASTVFTMVRLLEKLEYLSYFVVLLPPLHRDFV